MTDTIYNAEDLGNEAVLEIEVNTAQADSTLVFGAAASAVVAGDTIPGFTTAERTQLTASGIQKIDLDDETAVTNRLVLPADQVEDGSISYPKSVDSRTTLGGTRTTVRDDAVTVSLNIILGPKFDRLGQGTTRGVRYLNDDNTKFHFRYWAAGKGAGKFCTQGQGHFQGYNPTFPAGLSTAAIEIVVDGKTTDFVAVDTGS